MQVFRKSVLAAALTAVVPGTAFAQLEEVLVTATKREASVQDLPFSINAQSEEDIKRSGAFTLEELSRNVAGLTIQNLGPGQSQVAIRGVSAGQIVRDQPGVKEQVGVYLDESVISLSLFTPDIDLFDMNRVEVLRGPQGTLYGSGSLSGTVRYITNQPDDEAFSSAVEADLNTIDNGGNGGYAKAYVNSPMGDMAAGRTLIGPHRADLDAVFADKGVPARDCSTGEQKALLISLILANGRALARDFGAPPILLLDEVAAHLDATRRAALYDEICGLGAHAFMTGTGPELFAELADRAQYAEVTETDGQSHVTQKDSL